MVWATHSDGYHDFFNKQWYDYTGLSFAETKDKGWSLVLHPDDYARTVQVWQHSLRTGEDYQVEYRLRRNDRQYRWFLARALAMRDEQGNILKWFGTCTDIHDQKMVADILEHKVQERTGELQKANSELEASNIELMQFASVASHDLKEPLRKIHMFANLINDKYLTGNTAAADYMQRIITSSARMTRLINDLLDFSRLSVNSAFERTDLNLVMEEVLSDLEVAIREKEAVIKVGQLPQAEIIPGQIRQVFQNLVSNALKFSKKGEVPVIRITADKVERCNATAPAAADGAFIRLTITDNGIGFDDQYAERIFTIFQRLHSKEKYEGTGIGLAITKKIIERHNGLITAQSKEGIGTTFVMVLPQRQFDPALQ
jgi:two-component system, chemotaxis family, CheB/CheR fusion protein